MALVPIDILSGQSNAVLEGLDAALVDAIADRGGDFEFVKFADGGKSLYQHTVKADFHPDSGELFDGLVAAIQARIDAVVQSGHTPYLRSFYWVQGEADSRLLATAESYDDNLTLFIERLRDGFDAPELVFAVARLRPNDLFVHGDVLRQSQENVAANVPGVVLAETSDLALVDTVHYDLPSRFELALRLVNAANPLPGPDAAYVPTTTGAVIRARSIEVQGTLGDDTISGDAVGNLIHGNHGEDLISSGGGGDTVLGGVHDDDIRGAAGNDLLMGSSPNQAKNLRPYEAGVVWNFDHDRINGGVGNDTCLGGMGDDQINGGRGHDSITGSFGEDALSGEDGSDLIDGGKEHDVLSGGLGADTFVFRAGDGEDVIADFAAEDRVRFEGGLFADFADLQAHLSAYDEGTIVTGEGITVVIRGFAPDALTADHFVFA